MRSCNNSWSTDIYSNPLVNSIFNERFNGSLTPPGLQLTLITQDAKDFITLDGNSIVTQG